MSASRIQVVVEQCTAAGSPAADCDPAGWISAAAGWCLAVKAGVPLDERQVPELEYEDAYGGVCWFFPPIRKGMEDSEFALVVATTGKVIPMVSQTVE
jgi:hypothetical protein